MRHSDRAAVSFSLIRRDGTELASSDLHGKADVLAFWATWCRPCRWELPEIERLWDRHRGNPRVVVLAVDSLPTVILLDREGHVRMTHHGYDASKHVETLLSDGIHRLPAGRNP